MSVNYSAFLSLLPTYASGGKVMDMSQEEVESILENTKPFVFMPSGNLEMSEEYVQGEVLDLPFKQCFFEVLDKAIFEVAEPPHKEALCCYGIHMSETSPRSYSYYLLLSRPGKMAPVIHKIASFDKNDSKTDRKELETAINQIDAHILGVVKSFLRRIYKESVGSSSNRKSIKVRGPKSSMQHRLGKIIYIGKKSLREEINSSVGKEIDWSHRWRVRGHWREIPGRLGKDRDGNLIRDFTWVTDHVKGPEDQPIIDKIRVIKEEGERIK